MRPLTQGFGPRPMRIVVAAAFLLALLPVGAVPAGAQPRHHSSAAKSRAQLRADRRPTLLDQATKGNGQAQYEVGMATLHSRGQRSKLTARALVWLGLAAANGSIPAATEGATLLEHQGKTTEAARWWYRAGELGDQAARDRFVDLYLAGKADSLGGAAGANWLAARAEHGGDQAKLRLGEAYERGDGVVVNLAQARRWYLDAAFDDNTEAMYRLGRLDLRLPATLRAPGKETGHDGKWLGPLTYRLDLKGWNRDKKMPDLGRSAAAAANNLDPGDLHLYRPGMVEGERWLERAARRGHSGAQLVLGEAYLGGLDLPPDVLCAVDWLQAAAAQGEGRALMLLAKLAAEGQGYRGKDPVRAWVYYDLAAAQGENGAETARDLTGKTLAPRQMVLARQLAQDLRHLQAD